MWCKDKTRRLGMKDLDCRSSFATAFLGGPVQATVPHCGSQFLHL